VTELSANANVVVFPNPSSSDVTIKSSKGFASIQVFDLKGAELIHRQLSTTKNSEMLTISSLMSGVYFVQLLDSNGNEIAKIRFIKNDWFNLQILEDRIACNDCLFLKYFVVFLWCLRYLFFRFLIYVLNWYSL